MAPNVGIVVKVKVKIQDMEGVRRSIWQFAKIWLQPYSHILSDAGRSQHELSTVPLTAETTGRQARLKYAVSPPCGQANTYFNSSHGDRWRCCEIHVTPSVGTTPNRRTTLVTHSATPHAQLECSHESTDRRLRRHGQVTSPIVGTTPSGQATSATYTLTSLTARLECSQELVPVNSGFSAAQP